VLEVTLLIPEADLPAALLNVFIDADVGYCPFMTRSRGA
jgi:hypothetical protein